MEKKVLISQCLQPENSDTFTNLMPYHLPFTGSVLVLMYSQRHYFFYQKGCHSWEAGMAHSRAVLTEEFADKWYALMCFSQSYALQPNLWSGCSSEVWRNLSGCCE